MMSVINKRSSRIRWLTSLLAAAMLAFGAAAPTLAYTHVNNEHIRLSRLDPVVCGTPIRIDALVTDEHGTPSVGITVTFSLSNGEAGDVLSPQSSITSSSGHAGTTLTMSCLKGPRTVRASEPGGAHASITFVCNAGQGCGSKGSGAGDGAGSEHPAHLDFRVQLRPS